MYHGSGVSVTMRKQPRDTPTATAMRSSPQAVTAPSIGLPQTGDLPHHLWTPPR